MGRGDQIGQHRVAMMPALAAARRWCGLIKQLRLPRLSSPACSMLGLGR